MSQAINTYYVVFDNDQNINLFDINTLVSEFETQQEAYDVAMAWKKATGHSITVKCFYTVEQQLWTL